MKVLRIKQRKVWHSRDCIVQTYSWKEKEPHYIVELDEKEFKQLLDTLSKK